MNRDTISAMLFILVGVIYIFVKDYEMIFLCLAWSVGYWKGHFLKK